MTDARARHLQVQEGSVVQLRAGAVRKVVREVAPADSLILAGLQTTACHTMQLRLHMMQVSSKGCQK